MRLLPSALAAALLAGAAMPAAAQDVGVAAAVNQQARGTPPSRAVRTLTIGDNVIFNERIETNPAGLLQILLADGTAFTAGPNSVLTIDRFVYDPDAGTAEVSATLTKGVFRFIGGKTSKTPGGARLNSPVGTIGIRGAVVDVTVAGPRTASVAMVFGRETTLTSSSGRVNRVYEPGYSIVVDVGPDGRERRQVVKTPPAAASQIQTALAGRPGTNGGAASQPTDRIVADSEVPRENSRVALAILNPPVPQPRPQTPADVQTAVRESGFDLAQGDVEDTLGGASPTDPQPDPGQTPDPGQQPGPGPGPEPSPGPGPGPAPGPAPTAGAVRLLTAGETYVDANGRELAQPGTYGVLGGSDADDRAVSLAVPAGSATASGATNRGALVLPAYADGPFARNVIGADSGASLGGVPLSDGFAFRGEDGFRAYQAFVGGNRSQPLFAIGGTPLSDRTVLENGDIRTYGFSPDLVQNIPVPFTQTGALQSTYASAAITPFYLAEGSGSGSTPRMFQTWLLIEGTGLDQQSGIGVSTGALVPDGNGNLGFDFGRRGSFHNTVGSVFYAASGGIASVAGPSGGNELFGRNGQYMALGTDTESREIFSDTDLSANTYGSRFGANHVLDLQGEAAAAAFAAGRGTTQALGNGDRVLQGFASGIQEVASDDYGFFLENGTSGASPDNMVVQFNGGRRTVGAELAVTSSSGVAVNAAFGDGVRGNARNGQSAYIDDDTFGAIQNPSANRNTLAFPDGEGGAAGPFPQRGNDSAKLYLVSGDATPQPSILPNGKLCECAFLEWGWWGGQVRAATDPAAPNRETARSVVHLGQWVAGDIATSAQVSGLTGTATYQGSALGRVLTGSDDYVASGAMRMGFDFGSRTGSIAIDNFDGRDFAGSVASSDANGRALFSGNLAQANDDASGTVNGAFANNGPAVAAGVIGNFNLGSGNGAWTASGIVAGARQ